MNIVDEFFTKDNAVTGVTEEAYESIRDLVDYVDAFARMTYKSVYIIDYYKRDFLYVSENPLFLCGLSAEQVKEIGYNFYIDNVPKDDVDRLLRINSLGFIFSKRIPAEEKRHYTISYNFKIINTISRKVQTINHQLTPLKMMPDGSIWLALCVASIPPKSSDNAITMINTRTQERWNLDLESNKWRKAKNVVLTEQEILVLKYSAMGYTMNDIAKKIIKSFDSIKRYRKRILEKLGTDNITEAINYATTFRLMK
jgi:DNA-binding NarL/FixJ family response regulator